MGIEKTCRWVEKKYGIPKASLLSNAQIDVGALLDPYATVTKNQERAFYQSLVHHCLDEDLGFKAGYELTASCYGILGLALQSSATVMDGIRLGLRYIDFTYTFNTISFELCEDYGSIIVKPGKGLLGLSRFMVQRDLAAIVRLIYDGLRPSLPFAKISLSQLGFKNKHLFEKKLDCEIFLSQKDDRICLRRKDLSRPLNEANALTWRFCCEQLDKLQHQRVEQEKLSDQIYLYLMYRDSLALKMEDVAKHLNISVRSMRRKLSDKSSSYKQILESVRQTLATEYLSQPDYTLERVAEKLGYSDAVSFSHAFKRWYRCAPRASLSFDSPNAPAQV